MRDELQHVWHLFVIRTERRAQLQTWLNEKGIQTLIHYPIPPHQQKAYNSWADLSLPMTEQLHQQVLSLPLDPTMNQQDIQTVIDAVNGFQA